MENRVSLFAVIEMTKLIGKNTQAAKEIFLELVHFRAETDELLHKHLQYGPKNAKYTLKTIQNELISVVLSAQFYSIIAGEVTDVANQEQLSLCLRYVHDGRIQEVLVEFIELERITGEALATAILNHLAKLKLPITHLRGQYYDGASSMSGARAGCKSIVMRQAPKARYVHCAVHRLNLAVVSGCNLQASKNTEGTIGEIARFFHYSPKQQRFLEKAITVTNPSSAATKLKDTCRTRWIERIDSYAIFMQLLPSLHAALLGIVSPNEDLGTDWNWDADTEIH